MSSIEEAAARFYGADPTVFVGSTAERSIGWLSHIGKFEEKVTSFARAWFDDRPPRFEKTVLLGMGGSSAPAGMFAGLIDSETLQVLDTSNPDSISDVDFSNVNVIASSKSGTTIEMVTSLAWALSHGLLERDLSIITDQGSSLDQLAMSLGAKIFHGDRNTGGRFGALSAFGIVPAIAAGWEASRLIEASFVDEVSLDQFSSWFNEGAHFGMTRDYVGWYPLANAPCTNSVELWLEQLVAESTGKNGRGVIPVVDGTADNSVASESVVRDLYAHHVRVAAMAWHLGVDPFDQPDVEGAKSNVFSELRAGDVWSEQTRVSAEELSSLEAAQYVALQVFAPLSQEHRVESLRLTLSQRFQRVTAGLGPRFLHATGQLHKGGPANVAAVQILVRPESEPVRISGRNYTFHDLHQAQARADARALRSAGRTVLQLRVHSLDEVSTLFGE